MGYASYLVYRDGGGLFSGAAKLPLALYASQLALNWAWTPLFFGKHDVRSSFYEICALWLNIAACGLSFYAVNRTAGFQSLLCCCMF
jgi:benzodiazapine receptor